MPSYAHLEIRIFKCEADGYPVELTLLDSQQQFRRGILSADILTWRPEAELSKAGESLFSHLFADKELMKAWALIKGQAPRCRMSLRIDEDAPELHSIPWELLQDPDQGYSVGPLAADADSPFARFLGGNWPVDEPILERPINVLIAIAGPDDLLTFGLAAIDVALEQEVLSEAFSDLTAGQVNLHFLQQPITLAKLEAALKQGYHILHVVSHGTFSQRYGQARLFLADDNNDVHLIGGDEFVSLLDRLRQKPKLIFLASCQSASSDMANAFRGLAPGLIQAGIPAVVAMQDYVPIATVRAFTRAFYRSLFQFGQVDLACNEARSTLLTQNLAASAVPVLFSRLQENYLLAEVEGAIVEAQYFEPETIYIPAGPFLMGRPPDVGAPPAETPQHEVDLPAYRIGRYPVTNEQYAHYLQQTGEIAPQAIGWGGQIPPQDELKHPVTGVTWYDALAYCAWLSDQTSRNYSLPSEAQWEKAARGTDGYIYPWGNDWDEARCHHQSGQLAPVDAYPEGVSPYGCYDMVGNSREWVRTLWGENRLDPDPKYCYPWREDSREDSTISSHIYRVYRGGGAVDSPAQLTCCARNGYLPDRAGPRRSRHGFRVVMKI